MFRSIFRKDSNGSSRQRQIKTLRIYNKDVQEVSPDLFNVALDCAGGDYRLSVYLPSGYPEERPLLRLAPPMTHPWLDANQMVVAAPGLVNYTKHCELGQLVKNIVHELERCLAGGVPAATAADSSLRLLPGVLSTATVPSVPQHQVEYPELASLSTEQLQQLLEDDDLLDELVDRVPSVSALHAELHSSMLSCQQLAAGTLAEESGLIELRSTVSQLQDSCTQQLQLFDQLQSSYDQLCQRFSPTMLCQLLQIAASESEQAGEACVGALMEHALPVDAFIKQFIQLRTLYGLRRTKHERLSQQLAMLDSEAHHI